MNVLQFRFEANQRFRQAARERNRSTASVLTAQGHHFVRLAEAAQELAEKSVSPIEGDEPATPPDAGTKA